MKDLSKWIVWTLIAIVVSVLISVAILRHKENPTVGAITSPPTVLDFLQLQQALGFGPTGQTPVTLSGTRTVLAQASQFPCVIANPYNATSTVGSFSFQDTVGTTSTLIVIGTTTSATATSTTPFVSQTIATGAQTTLTFDGGVNNNIIGPGQFIVGGTGAGGLTTGVTYTGTCSATFQSVN